MGALTATTIAAIPSAVAAPPVDEEIARSSDASWHSVIVVMDDKHEEKGVPATTPQEKIDHVQDLIDTAKSSQRAVLAKLEGAEKDHQAHDVQPLYVVNAVSATVTKEVALDLAKTPGVSEVSIDHKIEADPISDDSGMRMSALGGKPAALHLPWNLRQISASEGLLDEYAGEGVTVGIIDSGVDVTHPALKDKWRGNTGDKAVSWYDTVGTTTEPVDSTGHGTHVAGTILGSDPSGTGYLGVAPKATFIAARVFDEEGETSDSRLLQAMQWMLAPVDSQGVRHPELAPRVVNNSWGSSATNLLFQDALKQWRKAGILPVFSAGNVDGNNPGGPGSITQPGSFPEAFAVGALRSDDVVAKFSLRGPSKYTERAKPDIAAPGVNIRSGWTKQSMKIQSGTSMAAPHVTGVAALVLGVNPKLTVDELESILRSSATPLTDPQHVNSPNHAYGAGKVNAALAIDMAKADSSIGTVQGNVYVRGVDADAPHIEHTPVSVFYRATTTDVTAKVTDDTGVASVSLKITGGAGERTEAMKLVKGTKVEGTYEFVVSPTTLASDDVSYRICATDREKKEACTPVRGFEQKVSVSVGWSEDFESGTDGFEMSGETPMWAWGAPAASLKRPTSGEKLVGVGLDGQGYPGLKDSVLLTPPIGLKAGDSAALTFKHWYDLDNYEYAAYDTAEVWVGEVREDGTVAWETKPQLLFKNHVSDWERGYVDLTAYAGKTIRVMFGVRGAWKSEHATAGWFIDDIALEPIQTTTVAKVEDELAITKHASGRTVIDFVPIKDEKISAYRLYRAHDDGPFSRVKELTGAEIGKYTVSFYDYPTPQQGTYSYYVTAVAGQAESEPSKILQRTFTVGEKISLFDFESDAQGWTSEPDGKGNVFERGIPSLDDTQATGKAPTTPQSAGKNPGSPNVFATVLNDYRKAKATYSLTSPSLDLSAYTDVTMYFQQWFNTRGRTGSDEWTTYDDDIGHIYVRANGGEWKEIFTLNDAKIEEVDPTDKKTALRTTNAWHVDGVAIPAEYLSANTQVKFELVTGSEIFDFAGGWFLDDILFANTAGATIPQPKLAQSASLGIYDGEELSAPTLAHAQAVANASGAEGDESWVPATSATVELAERGTKVSTEAGTGAYLLRGHAGEAVLVAKAPGYRPATATVQLADANTLTQHFYLEKANPQKVTFTVTDGSGKGVRDARVSVYAKGRPAPVFTEAASEPVASELLPGEYTLRAGAPGYLEADIPFTVEEGKEAGVDIELAPATIGETGWISYDSGNADAALTTLAGGKTAAVRFDAGQGSHVTGARFYIFRSGKAQDFEWALWEHDDRDGLPGRMLVGPVKARVEAGVGGGWVELHTPYPIPVHGSYYVSYTQLDGGKDRISLGVDSRTDGSERSFKLINDAWVSPDEKGQFMINAQEVSAWATSKPQPEPTPEPAPGQPDQPGQPDEPGQPDQPDLSDQSDQPGQPDQPGSQAPAKPDTPSVSATPTPAPETARQGSSLPLTGAQVGGLAALALLLGALGITAVTHASKKNR
ncbi:MAG: S8 family serine peptidase [Trueperella sp.]|uniref:S8 family serine peptidase n=1 Tax=Trueperella sp. TaxID=2699835 RepID=UPI0025F2D9B8|nr:S8 family serine peptidase [Trueperella sp.]MCI7305308.1 S8 family serine peptidase [Trueperella sp.]